MHARPSAKLIPAAHLDDLVSDGAELRAAAGEIGQVPADPDIAAIPDRRASRRFRGRRTWRASPVT